ncbi:CoA transferase subunit A [Desulfonema ishimotonii]|uniref:CoA transferase subunit A n=1 Tax=Desulfonema ishimotonii TaxID=45657 RepID=A0A401FZQ3_9BACT|nr:CoA transferase [Desulfonema ishimotonii]GBC62459.1 CoA transferase subunit A [Desulfonema ishimotonii]
MEKSSEMFWTGLTPDEARQALVRKDKSKRDKRCTLEDAVARFIKDGDNVAVGGFVNIRQPIAAVHEMIRHGFKDLTLSFQSGGMAIDYLGGAMAVRPDHFSIRRVEMAYWAHESFGLSAVFRHLAENGLIELEDWSNYNMSARFKAGAMGLPFIPCRSPLGSHVLEKCRAKVIDCPFTGTPIILLPASNPDVGILHVQAADHYGNCIIRGTDATCPEIAMASAHTIVTCEQLVSHELITRSSKDISIPFMAVDAVVHVPFGAYPSSCRRHYYFNREHMATFHGLATMARKGNLDGLRAYYNDYVFGTKGFQAFIDHFPIRKILEEQHSEQQNFERLA